MSLLSKNAPKPSSDQSQRRLVNLLGLDFGASGIKAVRLKKVKESVQLVAADILPATDLSHPSRPSIPKELSTYYASISVSSEDAMVRMVNQPLKEGESVEEAARENMSAPSGHRVAVKVIDRQAARKESSILGTAISDKVVQHYLDLFASGAPALHSLELASLAAFSAFWMGGSRPGQDQAVCLVEAGARYTTVGFFHRNRPLLINCFSLGSENISRQLQQDLGLDAEMAGTILEGGSIDISGSINTVLGPYLKQLSIYRQFVERQYKASLGAVYLSGGLASSADWRNVHSELLSLAPTVWNPFEQLTVSDDVDVAKFAGQEGRFAAVIGAALAGLEGAS